jgi:hypothetical protein
VRLSRFDGALLCAFAALSVWVLALDLWQVVVHGRIWTGTDGFYSNDQLQYLSWIRSSSSHLLVSNLFVLRGTPADYFQPAVLVSGVLERLGVPGWLALIAWKPVAVLACFFAVRRFVSESLSGGRARRSALALGLLYASFPTPSGSATVLGDLSIGFLSWGYSFGVIAIAAVTAGLVAYSRGWVWTAGALGALAGSLHPWNAEIFILAVLGAELMRTGVRAHWRARARDALPAVGLSALPLLYTVILARSEQSWQLARIASKHRFPLWSIVLELAPLLVPALLCYRRRPDDLLGGATRAWPLAALAVFFLGETGLGATPLHAAQGVTIPLAVLAVQGVSQLRLPTGRRAGVAAACVVALLTIPATAFLMHLATRQVAPQAGIANFIEPDERDALRYLAGDPRAGGVMSRVYLGVLIPAYTGRRTYVGDCIWSEPNCPGRLLGVLRLFTGQFDPVQAREFVLGTKARFLVSDCRGGANLSALLGPVILGVHRFGCADVYDVR